MGFHGSCNTQKRRNLHMSKHKVTAMKKKLRRQRRRMPQGQIHLLDAQLMSREQLRKRQTNPTANIALSAKKRNKLLKALRHSIKAKEATENDSSDGYEDCDDDELGPDDHFDPKDGDEELTSAIEEGKKQNTSDDVMELGESSTAQ